MSMSSKSVKVSPSSKTPLRKPEYCNPRRNMDLGACVIDEVALEGLEGVTLQALFVRLSRRPGFTFTNDDDSKAYIWNITKRLKEISMFLLNEERPILEIQDRRDFVDERGNMYEPVDAPEDIYEYFAIDDRQLGVRGSCREYYSRRIYSSVARQLSYSKACELYGNRLVLVARQGVRERTILPEDADMDRTELTIIQYCILERIARARYVGEITRGKVSMTTMKIDPKSLFYQRKLLIKKSLITKQSFSMKYGATRSSASVTILHLPKFFTYYETVVKSGIGKSIKSILSAPNKHREISYLRAQFGKHTVRNLLSKDCSAIFEQVDMFFSEFNPEACANEPILEKRQRMKRRVLKVLRLRDPRINHINFVKLLPTSAGDEKEEIDESVISILPISFYTTQTSVVYNFLQHIFEAKAKGTSLMELSERNCVTLLDSRTAVRLLQRHKSIAPVLEDKKKTKMNRYVFFKFREANRNVQKISLYPEMDNSIVPLQKSVFIDLEPEHQRYEKGEIVWSIPDLGPKSASIIKTDKEKEREIFESNSRLSARKSSLLVNKPERRGNSYKLYSEDLPPASLRLSPEVRTLIENFISDPSLNSADLELMTDPYDLRFNKGEGKDFIPITETGQAKCLVYYNSTGWHIFIEAAEIRPEFGKLPSFGTPRNTERGNFILEHIYRFKVVPGFQQILRKLRTHEFSKVLPGCERFDIDRRTVYRILGQLQYNELIQIFKVSINKSGIKKMCVMFTPFSVEIHSKVITSTIDMLVNAAGGKRRMTIEEHRARSTRRRLLKKGKRKKNNIINQISKPIKLPVRKKAARTSASKIVKKVVKVVKGKSKSKHNGLSANSRYYDDTDREALARLKRVRVTWSPKEDRCILCIFLASVLFIPRYNHQRIFMFNTHQIRDILHSKIEVGKSKTALAVRRRLHFLMKKKAFYNRYRYYLTEALSDKGLMKKYLKRFYETKTSKIFNFIPTKLLLRVVEYLQEKFQKLYVGNTIHKAGDFFAADDDTFKQQEDESQYDEYLSSKAAVEIAYIFEQPSSCLMVDAYHTPYDVISISVWTARTAILSLIFTGDNAKDVNAFLSTINADVLSYSINALRMIGLTSWEKQNSRLGPSVLLKRTLQADLSPEKYHEGYVFLNELNDTLQKTFRSEEDVTVGSFIVLSELFSRKLVHFDIHLADPVITINPEWQATFDSIVDGMEDKVYEENDSDGLEFDDEVDDPTFKVNESTKRTSPLGNIFGCFPKRANRTETVPRQLDSLSTPESNVKASLKTDIIEEVLNEQNESLEALNTEILPAASTSKSLRLSNKAMRVIRSQVNSKESGSFIQRDFFCVNLPDISVLFDRSTFDTIIEATAPNLDLTGIKQHLIKVVFCSEVTPGVDFTPVIKSPQNLGQWKPLYDYILKTKEIGVSVLFLRTKFTRKTLSEGLRYLVLNNCIFLVGITYRKFVSIEFMDKWTVAVPDSQNDKILKRVVCRPWVSCMGGLNWTVLDEALTSILGYLKLYPDASVEALCEYFVPVWSPVEIMVLVDTLVGMDFFNLYELENKVIPDAFTPPSVMSKNYNVDAFVDMEKLYIELHCFTLSKYSNLQELINTEAKAEEGTTTYSKYTKDSETTNITMSDI